MYFIISENQREVLDSLLDASLVAHRETTQVLEAIDRAMDAARKAFGLPGRAFRSCPEDSRHAEVQGAFRQALIEGRLYHLP